MAMLATLIWWDGVVCVHWGAAWDVCVVLLVVVRACTGGEVGQELDLEQELASWQQH